MADIWDAMTVNVEPRWNETVLHIAINGFTKTVENFSHNPKLLATKTMQSAEEIADTIRSVIIHRVREQLEEIEKADETTGGTDR